MSAVVSLAGFMKKHVLGQRLVRRNPFYYDRAVKLLDQTPAFDYERRRAWTARQVRQTLRLAQRTEYGRSVRGGDTLSSWPLLDKESLRHGLQSFTTGYSWFSAPATTGGTSGVPLKVLRSLEAIVFEQATIDRVIQSLESMRARRKPRCCEATTRVTSRYRRIPSAKSSTPAAS
jgi:phenylacetate-CoA ligase